MRTLLAAGALALAGGCGAQGTATPQPSSTAGASVGVRPPARAAPAQKRAGAALGAAKPGSFAIGLQTLRLVDRSRTVTLPEGRVEPRTLVTVVRYPALGRGGIDLANAPAARAAGPFPLIVFAHGFAVTPAPYRRLLQSWARAGYVVAAPVFPRESAGAVGGPDEADLVNQPADMSFVISRVIAAGAAPGGGPLAGLLDAHAIAVAGQSDGGDTALASAYDPRYRDRRIDAAVILSGAEIPVRGPFAFPSAGPALLATQGTADTVNTPAETETFFAAAHPPKYLLRLLGAEHLPPYVDEQPQLGIIERVSTSFLDGYLKHRRRAIERLRALGSVPETATMTALG